MANVGPKNDDTDSEGPWDTSGEEQHEESEGSCDIYDNNDVGGNKAVEADVGADMEDFKNVLLVCVWSRLLYYGYVWV